MIKKMMLLCLGLRVFFSLLLFGASSETYIDYTLLSKIEVEMNRTEVVSILGEPILILSDSEFDNSVFIYYNYKVKQFGIDNGVIDINLRDHNNERSTLIKFTFIDDELKSFEEDKITLSMAGGQKQASSPFLHYFSMLLNIMLLIKII